MRLWRISGYADLLGVGGLVSGGRWHVMGIPIVYCADHPATALLEILVHVDAEDMPETYQLLEIDVPDGVAIMSPGLPDDWKEDLAMTRQLGSGFVTAATHAVMEVPCAIVPFTRNYLLNPDLLARDGIRIVGVTTHPVDTRLLG
ncbi:RES family NAD+ phosphorylase [Mesorhizobium sp. YC-39]|uniref:RES family NAD+ phosphorylase n=1 Tax=unclassified Mesorhizobium TaxID=325217 RepID=UPI0021E6EEAB|nr:MULTISPECIES: RES family NAD+ phosphorylase [unclassified Mesorhizobium]MCV3210153.1 RES family NAD+ phosphorylase [Mesorhizobium sp. YC-2]MCV3230683.1 RES family NAD+ phosphorylase [Mesorhizobium sp. YC-39]